MPDPTPAPAAPAAPAPGGEPAQPQQQPTRTPRAADGTFAPAPKPEGQPELPRRLKLPTGEEFDEEEAVARLSERQLDNRAIQARLKRLQELEQLEQKLQSDPTQALPQETLRRLAVKVAQDWAREQEEANLPPEQKAMLQRERQLREREERIRAEEQRRAQEAEEQQMATLRQEAVETVTAAMERAGLPKTPATAKRLLGIMATAAKNGVVYPPEVLARKLRASYDADAQEDFKALGGKGVLTRYPALVEMLNRLEDAEVLQKLAPLGERLRRLNLQAQGLTPAAPAPDNVRKLPPQQPPRQEAKEDPLEVQRRINERARGR